MASNSSRESILVTGGAGYIGSHVVRHLGLAGERVVTIDNMSRGTRDAVTYGELVEGDIGDAATVGRVLADHRVRTVMHFAARTHVAESVTQPLSYYRNNVCATRVLLECCSAAGVDEFIFSSSAAVYGNVPGGIADEKSPTSPINPYGATKLAGEWMLRDTSVACARRFVTLRYFNVGGAEPTGRIGQSARNATLLTKAAAEHVVGRRPYVSIYGTDYPTKDGSGVRDYVHIGDVSSAHVAALAYLRAGGRCTTLNVGYGRGASVREVLDVFQLETSNRLVVREEPRRLGDLPMLVARADLIRTTLDWTPRNDSLEQLVADTLRWERTLMSRATA